MLGDFKVTGNPAGDEDWFFHDRWLSCIASQSRWPSNMAQVTICAACRKAWPALLMWPGKITLSASDQEEQEFANVVHDLVVTGSVTDGEGFVSPGSKSMHGNGGASLLSCSDEEARVSIMHCPPCCPRCYHALQRRPAQGADAPFFVILRSPLHNAMLDHALSRLDNHFQVVELGQGRRAIRMCLGNRQMLQHVMQMAMCGIAIDYLPQPQAHNDLCVHLRPCGAGELPSWECVRQWLVQAGRCSVALDSAGNEEEHVGPCMTFVLEDAESWERALALNGEALNGVVVSVMPHADGRQHDWAPQTCRCQLPVGCRLGPRPRHVTLLRLRAIRGLPVASRRMILAFAGSAPLAVPLDVASIEEALETGADMLVICTGVYHLRCGITLRRRVHIAGETGAELVLGAPVVVRSRHGLVLRDLTIRAHVSTGPAVECGGQAHGAFEMPSSLIRVDASFITAVVPSSRRHGGILVRCSLGRPAVVIRRCRLVGGRHGVEARGSWGLRPRAGRFTQRREQRLDFQEWMARTCEFAGVVKGDLRDVPAWPADIPLFRTSPARSSPEDVSSNTKGITHHWQHLPADSLSVDVSSDLHAWSCCPFWTAQAGTRLCIVDSVISCTVEEAVSAVRGASVELVRSTLRSCGQGVTMRTWAADAAACFSKESSEATMAGQMRLLAVDCHFEDLLKHAWSSAVAAGRDGSSSAAEVYLLRNKIQRCSVGVVVDCVRMHAEQNVLLELKLGGLQSTSSTLSLLENKIEDCGGVGVALSSRPDGHSSAELRGNCLESCNVGMQVRASGTSHCHLSAVSDTYTANGEAICAMACASVNKHEHALTGKPTGRCMLALSSCRVLGSKRSAIRIGRGVRARIWHCDLLGNGRGVLAGAWTSVNIQHCRFGDNIGWGVRLEGVHGSNKGGEVENQGGRASTEDTDYEPSVLSYNMFVSSQRGAVGSKRIRIDPWHELRTNADSNAMEASGCEVQPELKRHRQLEQEDVDATAAVLARLSFG